MATKRFRTPGAERQSALEAATQLMAEREKYEQWLDDLEAKKDSTPAKVFDRVRQDYLARLQTVMEQLGQHTATLQEHAENLVAKLRDLEEAEAKNEEEQAEAELRKQVGEITAAEYESGSRKSQRELSKIKENQLVILTDLNRIRDLLGGDEEEEDAPSEPGKSSKDFNELEFLTSVVGATPPAPEAPAAPKRTSGPESKPVARSTPQPAVPAVQKDKPQASPTPAAAAPAAPAEPADPAEPAAPAAPSAAPAAAAQAAPAAATAAAKPPEPPVAQDSETLESPHIPRASGLREQTKTLKCTECGAMNSPSEWYCERCGAELTVV